MLTVIMEHRILSGIYLSLLLLSIICQIVTGVIYQKMIKETDNMSATENKLLKQLKLKFANCYQLNGGVANISVFVDRFIGKITVMKITLTGIQHLSGQLMLLSVAAAGLGACREIIHGETVGRILPYYIASFLGLYAWFSISGLVDIQGKKEKLKTGLVDYLENHMVNRLKQSKVDWTKLTGEEAPVIRMPAADKEIQEKEALREKIGLSAVRNGSRNDENAKQPDHVQSGIQSAGKEIMEEEAQAVFSRQEEQELEELLREFFA